ncbi:hypothetical protein GMRT_12552 [Giardia muris]|uniref:Uncharacterized protein n=1 Tax=Giardia muris TaxID=5742 RepID=A0A4Z1SRQ5_GIAMU|nr:hypothetical protein GMRT_12552 [Giardia muris]|eukprot:TNJ28420.1 hypothetical protein GMRT_12552 [Giardia muris]
MRRVDTVSDRERQVIETALATFGEAEARVTRVLTLNVLRARYRSAIEQVLMSLPILLQRHRKDLGQEDDVESERRGLLVNPFEKGMTTVSGVSDASSDLLLSHLKVTMSQRVSQAIEQHLEALRKLDCVLPALQGASFPTVFRVIQTAIDECRNCGSRPRERSVVDLRRTRALTRLSAISEGCALDTSAIMQRRETLSERQAALSQIKDKLVLLRSELRSDGDLGVALPPGTEIEAETEAEGNMGPDEKTDSMLRFVRQQVVIHLRCMLEAVYIRGSVSDSDVDGLDDIIVTEETLSELIGSIREGKLTFTDRQGHGISGGVAIGLLEEYLASSAKNKRLRRRFCRFRDEFLRAGSNASTLSSTLSDGAGQVRICQEVVLLRQAQEEAAQEADLALLELERERVEHLNRTAAETDLLIDGMDAQEPQEGEGDDEEKRENEKEIEEPSRAEEIVRHLKTVLILWHALITRREPGVDSLGNCDVPLASVESEYAQLICQDHGTTSDLEYIASATPIGASLVRNSRLAISQRPATPISTPASDSTVDIFNAFDREPRPTHDPHTLLVAVDAALQRCDAPVSGLLYRLIASLNAIGRFLDVKDDVQTLRRMLLEFSAGIDNVAPNTGIDPHDTFDAVDPLTTFSLCFQDMCAVEGEIVAMPEGELEDLDTELGYIFEELATRLRPHCGSPMDAKERPRSARISSSSTDIPEITCLLFDCPEDGEDDLENALSWRPPIMLHGPRGTLGLLPVPESLSISVRFRPYQSRPRPVENEYVRPTHMSNRGTTSSLACLLAANMATPGKWQVVKGMKLWVVQSLRAATTDDVEMLQYLFGTLRETHPVITIERGRAVGRELRLSGKLTRVLVREGGTIPRQSVYFIGEVLGVGRSENPIFEDNEYPSEGSVTLFFDCRPCLDIFFTEVEVAGIFITGIRTLLRHREQLPRLLLLCQDTRLFK